ncbi:MAG: hypothetical protein QOC64_1766 [Solirubrobacteraceae bacterium]|jgi:hypothetical protein|nr:hypothetical protein [Solirubrobacteraceae bacterium]
MTHTTALASHAPALRDGRPLPPADHAVPQLPSLLDRDAMAAVLQRSLRGRSAVDEVQIASIDYRPGSGATVIYDAWVDGRRHLAVAATGPAAGAEAARTPARLAIARALGGDSPAARPLMYDVRLGALVQWYPLDHRIPVLAKPAAELGRVLSLAGIAVDPAIAQPETLLYRPGQRAVLRFGDLVLKAYADDDGFRAGVAGLRLAERLGAGPRLELALSDLRLTVQPAIDGVPVLRERAAAFAAAAGAMLRTLHEADVPDLEPVSPQRLLNTVAAAGTLVATVAPELAPQVRRLVRRLAAATPHGLAVAPAHGDYNLSQFLDVDGALAVLDFDEACLAPPALDVAAYAANLVSGRPGDLDAAEPALEALLDGYGDRPEGLRWYLAASIARRAPTPFRRHKRRWPERMASILDAAEAVLAP